MCWVRVVGEAISEIKKCYWGHRNKCLQCPRESQLSKVFRRSEGPFKRVSARQERALVLRFLWRVYHSNHQRSVVNWQRRRGEAERSSFALLDDRSTRNSWRTLVPDPRWLIPPTETEKVPVRRLQVLGDGRPRDLKLLISMLLKSSWRLSLFQLSWVNTEMDSSVIALRDIFLSFFTFRADPVFSKKGQNSKLEKSHRRTGRRM